MSFAMAFGLILASTGFSRYLLFLPRKRPYFALALLVWSGYYLSPAADPGAAGIPLGGGICLFLFACALLLARSDLNYRMIIAGSLSCFVGWIGLIGLFGHFVDTDLELSWGSYSHMSSPTALTMIFLGFALPVSIYLKNKLDHRFYAFAFYVALLCTSVTMLMEQTFVRVEVQKMRQEIKFKSDSLAWEIKSALMTQYQGFRRMASRIENGTYHDHADWAADAAATFRDFKGIHAIHWADANYVLRWVYPVAGNEPMLNRDMKQAPERYTFLKKGRESRQDIFSPPWTLLSGGEGFVLILPLFKAKKYLGSLGLSYKFDELFPVLLNLQGYSLEIFDGEALIYRLGSPDRSTSERWVTQQNLQILNRQWSLVLTPDMATLHKQSSFVPSLVLLFGMVISTAMSLAAYFYLSTRHAEKKSREFLQWQNAVMAGSPLMILSADQNMRVKSLNRYGEKLTGYSQEEVIGRYIPTLMHSEWDPGYEEFLERIRRGEFSSGEWIYNTRDGRQFRGAVVVSPLYADDGELSGFVSLIEDVTEKRNQEAKLITSARLASLGEMAAGIAHEINNPLTIIGAHSASVRRDLGAGHEVEIKKLEAIERTVQRIAKIIRGLRSFAREISQEQKTEISVRALVDDTLSFCAERFKNADIELETDIEENVLVNVQEHQISQVLLNLLNNAYDATAQVENKKVRLTAHAREGGVEISVEDTGLGVPPELREKIMLPFFTTKEVGQGLGLGLSISRGIISAHGGKLYLDGDAKRTRFVIWLPG